MEIQVDAFGRAEAFSVDMGLLEREGGHDPAFGSVTWRTLICADRTPSRDMVLGIAEFGPQGTLLPHRHTHAEYYLGLSGEGVVTVEGQAHRIAPGIALYLPSEAEHSVLAGPEGLSFVYGFAAHRFEEVQYRFSAAVAG
ncbi:MAG: cupin domain-containing protein [Rhodobacteraceae bacterium]|nr:cupin domain-containing protein [Paracoccaceae bacterium]